MSPEARDAWSAAGRALAAADRRLPGGGTLREALARRAIGETVEVVRGRGVRSGPWREEGLALRLARPDGAEALVASARWDQAEELAARAAGLLDAGARSPQVGGAAPARPGSRPVGPAPEDPGDALRPGAEDLVATFTEACLSVDPRVTAVDRVAFRRATVESYLAASDGRAVHGRSERFELTVAIVARDGLRVTSITDAVTGPRLDLAGAAAWGRELGADALRELEGVAAAPVGPTSVLLGSRVVGEITRALAPGLLGLTGPRLPWPPVASGLRLEEDSDGGIPGLWPPTDGAGEPLERRVLLAEARFRPGGPEACPVVRAGLGDPPRPGPLRLTWGFTGSPPTSADAAVELVRARTLEADPATFAWRGVVSGHRLSGGMRRRPLARLLLEVRLPDLLRAVVAGGPRTEAVGENAGIRAIPLLAEDVVLRSWTVRESA